MVEPLLMGMPLVFDRKAAGEARATIQFRVSGAEAGDYHVRIGERRWRLRLRDGVTVELPAEGVAEALVRLPDLMQAYGEVLSGRGPQDPSAM